MLEYIALVALVVAVTVALLCLGAAGTKETSFEDALAEQMRQRQKELGPTKAKKPKIQKKTRPTRPRSNQSNGSSAAPRSASVGHESAGTTTEDDNPEERLQAAHRRQQEVRRHQAEQQKQLEREKQERERQQAEQQRQLEREKQERERQQAEQQRQQERERLEREAQQAEQQKQREREAQQQEEERQQKHQQQMLDQQQQEIADQESKKSEKKRKLPRSDEAKQKQQKALKSSAGLVNGVHLEAVATNGMTVDGMARKGAALSARETGGAGELGTADRALQNGSASTSLAPLTSKKKKQKSDKTVSVQTILQTVEEAQLSSDQLQQVVDSLLAAAADGGWSEARKGADVAVSKKLEEALSTITRHQEAQATLTGKISELRSDLNSERSRSTQLKRQLDAAEAEQQRLMERDQQVQLQHKQQMQQAIKQQVTQQLQEERVRLKREYDDKLRQLEVSSAETARAAREGALQHVQQQEQAALRRIQELQAEVAAANTQAQYASEQLARAKDELEARAQAAQQEVQRLTGILGDRTLLLQRLQQENEALQQEADQSARCAADSSETSSEFAALELRVSAQATELEQKKQHADSLSVELSRVKTELESVKTKNNELREKNSSVLRAYQELEARETGNSAAARHMEESYRQLLTRLHPVSCVPPAELESGAWQREFEESAQRQRAEEANKRRQGEEEEVEVVEVIIQKETKDQQMVANLVKLEEENKQLIDKVARLEEERLAAQKDLAQQQLSATALAQLQHHNQQLQHDNQQLQHDNQQLQHDNQLLQEQTKQLQEQTKQLQEQTEQLQRAEKQLQELQEENRSMRLGMEQLEGLQKDRKKLEMLQEEYQHLQNLLQTTEQLQEENKKLHKLEEDNRQLQDKVLHYQSVLDSTETLLTSLQKSVEHEEGSWVALVKAKEDKIEEITKENEKLSEQILASSSADKLQAELEQARQEKAALQQQVAILSAQAAEVTSLRELLAEGVEAGKEQEQIIEQLQAELESTKGVCSATSNGVSSADAASDDAEGKQ